MLKYDRIQIIPKNRKRKFFKQQKLTNRTRFLDGEFFIVEPKHKKFNRKISIERVYYLY